MSQEAPPLRDVIIIGGGCYGTFYARQLESAQRKGRVEVRRIVLVDHDPDCRATRELEPRLERELVVADWGEFLRGFLDAPPPPPGAPDDAIVPSPLMPHLMASWLRDLAAARSPGRAIRLVPAERPLGTPYDALGPDGTRYVSFADWICPTHCIEPMTCPMIRAPRTWEMGEALEVYTAELAAQGPALFTTRHYAFGVGMFGAREIRANRDLVLAAGNSRDPVDVVVATVSACHGAVSILRIGAR